MKVEETCKKLNKIDIYGQRIDLTFKNNAKFQTDMGAVATIISSIILLWYGIQ